MSEINKVEPLKPETSYALSFDFIGGKDVMPIAGFHGPYDPSHCEFKNDFGFPSMITEENFKLISEANINLIVKTEVLYDDRPEMVEKSLELAGKYNVGYYVRDQKIIDQIFKEELDTEWIKEEISKFSHYPAFCGLYLIDEPTSRDYYWHPELPYKNLSAYAELSTFLQKDLGIPCYINLYACMKYHGDEEGYRKYVEEYARDMNQKAFTYDLYLWEFYEENRAKHYFWNIGVMREYAEKYNRPFWSYIQVGGQWNDAGEPVASKEYYPSEGQFYYNVNTCLASGAKGILYFPLMQPIQFAVAEEGTWDFKRNGLIGLDGNKTPWYYYAQKINKHIGVIDEVLMNSVSKGIIVNGDRAVRETSTANYVIKSGTFQELQSVTGDALVGCFNYNGKTALYVVNYDYECSQELTLHFDKEHEVTIVQNAEKSYAQAKNLTLYMEAGEGVLLVIE